MIIEHSQHFWVAMAAWRVDTDEPTEEVGRKEVFERACYR